MLSATLLSQETGLADGIVRASGAQLTCHGRPYRAIGVNVPHLSHAYMGTWHHWQSIYGSRTAMRTAIEEAVADAARHQVAFIRFFASPGYPKGTAELYGHGSYHHSARSSNGAWTVVNLVRPSWIPNRGPMRRRTGTCASS